VTRAEIEKAIDRMMEQTGEEEDMEIYFKYLDQLRVSGVTNMFGAGPYVQREFGVDRKEAKRIVLSWMRSFSDRHNVNPGGTGAEESRLKEQEPPVNAEPAYDPDEEDRVEAALVDIDNIDDLASSIGYHSVGEFFQDNPGAIQVLIEFILNNIDSLPEWKNALLSA